MADSRFSVPVISSTKRCTTPDVWALFEAQLLANCSRFKALATCSNLGRAQSAGVDARTLCDQAGYEPLASKTVDMILTSPPYAGDQKYVRASSLSLGWLGLARSDELRVLEDCTIGREHYPKATVLDIGRTGIEAADALIELVAEKNPMRAKIAATYLLEMESAFRESIRVLRPGGYFVLVIGDNTVCGYPFASSRYLKEMLERLGLCTVLELTDTIKSRGLMTTRALTSGLIANESVPVFTRLAE